MVKGLAASFFQLYLSNFVKSWNLMSKKTFVNLVLIAWTSFEQFEFNQNLSLALVLQSYILYLWMSKMYDWLSTLNDEFWLILNYSKVVWDINIKFSPVSVLIRFQLFTKFERHSLKNEAAMPLTIKNFSRAWQGHFLSQALQTWQICFFLVDVQMILLSYLDTSDCLEIEKNEKAFHSSCSELLAYLYVKVSSTP